MVRCIFRKRRLLKPPRIKSKTGCPEVDLLTEFHCIIQTENALTCDNHFPLAHSGFDKEEEATSFSPATNEFLRFSHKKYSF